MIGLIKLGDWGGRGGGDNPRDDRCSPLNKLGEGSIVEKGDKRNRLDKPGTEIIDSERGDGEYRGLGGSRLHKPRGRGRGRERKTSDSLGRVSRRPRVVPSSHDDKPRHGKIASDPDRVSDDGG